MTDASSFWSLGIYNRTLAAGTSDRRMIIFKEAVIPAYAFTVPMRGIVPHPTSPKSATVPKSTSIFAATLNEVTTASFPFNARHCCPHWCKQINRDCLKVY